MDSTDDLTMHLDLFKKEYGGEDIADLGRDVQEALDEDYNLEMLKVPQDDGHIAKGTFTVTIKWHGEV